MRMRRFLSWRWCPHPERMKATRTRPSERSWAPLVVSAFILSLLAVQGIQPWAPSAVNVVYPNSYGAFPTAEPASPLTTPEATEPSQITSVITTEHMNVQFSFPDSADPGQTITVTATSTARSSAKVISLLIEIYAYVDRQLVRAASETVLANKQVRSGNSWQSTLSVTVPYAAQRSAIIGTVKEIWEERTTTYYYSSMPFWPYSPYYPPYPPYNYTAYYVYTPSYVVTEKSSQQTTPLTYVLATTPEYEALAQKYEQLQQDYDKLTAQYNDLVSKYDSLRSEYDQTVSRYNQLQSNYNSATAELDSYKTYTYILVVVAVALGAAVVFLLMQRHQVTETPAQRKAPPAAPQKMEK